MKKKVVAARDFNVQSLPRNRKEQFKDVVKHNFRLFFQLGFILLLFAIPIFISIIIKDVAMLSLAMSGETDSSKIFSMTFSTNLIYYATLIPSILIFSIGLGGVMKILKELIYSEPIFFKEDFKQGIKQNLKPFLIIALFVSVFAFVGNLFYMMMNNVVLQVIPTAINYGIIFPVCYLSFFLVTIYRNTFVGNIKYSLILYVKYFPIQICLYGLTILSVLLKMIPISLYFVKYIALILMFVFIYPYILFGDYIYQISIYDKIINKEQFPEYYRKGLFIDDEKKNK